MDEKKSAAYLREKRIALDLTLSELAEKVGVGAYDVSCWEAGFFPEAKYLLPLSRALGVSVEEILKGEDEPPETFSAPRASGELPEARPAGQGASTPPSPGPAEQSAPAPQASPRPVEKISVPAAEKARGESGGRNAFRPNAVNPFPAAPQGRKELLREAARENEGY